MKHAFSMYLLEQNFAQVFKNKLSRIYNIIFEKN